MKKAWVVTVNMGYGHQRVTLEFVETKEREMREAAARLDFELATTLRDEIRLLQKRKPKDKKSRLWTGFSLIFRRVYPLESNRLKISACGRIQNTRDEKILTGLIFH